MSPEPELTEAEQAIHVAICEGSPEDCKDWRGRCVKAAEAVRPIIAAETLREEADNLERAVPSADAMPNLFVVPAHIWLRDRAALRTTTPEEN